MSVQTRKLIGRSLLLLVALTMIGAMLAACAPAAPAPAAQPTAAPAARSHRCAGACRGKGAAPLRRDGLRREDAPRHPGAGGRIQRQPERDRGQAGCVRLGRGPRHAADPDQRRAGARPGKRQRAMGRRVVGDQRGPAAQ